MVDRMVASENASTPSSRGDGKTLSPRLVTPLERPNVRLADEIAHVLREQILNGTLESGTPLLQVQLADQLGVSRTPLREAIRMLERDGLVQVSNGNKTVEVVSLDIGAIAETYQIREVIDGLAARLAARRGLSPEADQHLVDCIDAMDAASRDEVDAASRDEVDAAAYGTAHADFHLSILDATGNSKLSDLVPLVRLSSQMLLTRYLQQEAYRHPGLLEDLARTAGALIHEGNMDHRGIYEAIRDGKAREAETAAKRHIRKTLDFAVHLHGQASAPTPVRNP